MLPIIMFTWLTIYMVTTVEVVMKGEDGVHPYVLNAYRTCKWIAVVVLVTLIINYGFEEAHKIWK